jgi:hypothetical protein
MTSEDLGWNSMLFSTHPVFTPLWQQAEHAKTTITTINDCCVLFHFSDQLEVF